MHFEILVEDKSGQIMLETVLAEIITGNNTFRIHSYKGCGAVPKNLRTDEDPAKRILLDQLPRLLSGYGNTYQADESQNAVIVICDLDKRNKESFLGELNAVLDHCKHKPIARFCLAVEEGEAWLLGDIHAVIEAYPKADVTVLHNYKNDSICGTWEVLADAVYTGGSVALNRLGYQETGKAKAEWAARIPPYMDLCNNRSPSFNCMKQSITKLLTDTN